MRHADGSWRWVLSRGLAIRDANGEPSRMAGSLSDVTDRVELVNDSLSHAVGDNLLVALAGRLAGLLRPGDTVARIGGDEFTMLLVGVLAATHARASAAQCRHRDVRRQAAWARAFGDVRREHAPSGG